MKVVVRDATTHEPVPGATVWAKHMTMFTAFLHPEARGTTDDHGTVILQKAEVSEASEWLMIRIESSQGHIYDIRTGHPRRVGGVTRTVAEYTNSETAVDVEISDPATKR
jgi:hypothetical protein